MDVDDDDDESDIDGCFVSRFEWQGTSIAAEQDENRFPGILDLVSLMLNVVGHSDDIGRLGCRCRNN